MKRDRFDNLEAPRAETPREQPRVSSRFAAVDAPPKEPALAVEARGEGRKQLRCAECGHENGRYAGTCAKCGTPLDTRATRRLNERLFQDERLEQRIDGAVQAAIVEEKRAERSRYGLNMAAAVALLAGLAGFVLRVPLLGMIGTAAFVISLFLRIK